MSTPEARAAGKAALLDVLTPVLDHLAALGTPGPGLAPGLNEAFPIDGDVMQGVFAVMQRGIDEGWLCPRENAGVKFGRVAKPTDESRGFSIDAVIMDGPGPGHTHPKGEIDLCFATAGRPTFDGNAPGWTAYGPESWHVPTVAGGQMAILYFLPEGAMRFESKPAR